MARLDQTHRSVSTPRAPTLESSQGRVNISRIAQLLRDIRTETTKSLIDYEAVTSIIAQVEQQLKSSPSAP